MTAHKDLPVAVIGAGPVGLAAASHLAERGMAAVVLEAGKEVGANIMSWGHVRLFSPWRFNMDPAARRLLEGADWAPPDLDHLPTGRELVLHYLRPLAARLATHTTILTDAGVTHVARVGLDKVHSAGRDEQPLVLQITSAAGNRQQVLARAVIDATGTWTSPNPLGANGLPALGEDTLSARIHYGIPDVLGKDRAAYANKTVLVVGAGHSAANTIISLAELARTKPATRIVWATRKGASRVLGGGAQDALPARGRIGQDLQRLLQSGALTLEAHVQFERIHQDGGALSVAGTRRGEPVEFTGIDRVVVATGQRPDTSMTRELRIAWDPALECVPALAPLIDPNVHSCGTVPPHGVVELTQPEPSFFVIGAKSYGRAPTFLLATGFEQARSVVAALAGDMEAARRVELNLPQTGVCGVPADDDGSNGCCAPGPARSCC